MNLNNYKIIQSRQWPLVLSINLGTQSLKYLILQRKGRKLKVLGFGRFSLDDEGMGSESFQQLVRWVVKKIARFKGIKTVLGLEGQQIVINTESLPALSRKELQQTIHFGIEREFSKEGAGVPFISDFLSLGPDPENEGNYQYMTMGAAEEAVEEKIYPFASEGVVPTKVIPSVLAVANLVRLIPDVNEQDMVGILDIGAQRSIFVVLKNGKIDYFREIAIGGDDFTKGITGTIFHEGRAIQFKTEEALEFKLKYGYPIGFSEEMTFLGAPLSEVGMMMRPVVERLLGEVQRSIGFYKEKSGGRDVECLYLVGGGARLKHLPDVLAEKMDIPVTVLPVPEELSVSGGVDQQKAFHHKFSEQAIGLALALESSPEGNLLPKSHKLINRMAIIQRGLRCLAAAVVVLLVFLTYTYRSKIISLGERIASMEARVSRSTNSGPMFESLQNKKLELDMKIRNLSRMMEQDETLIQVLRLFSHTVPENMTLILLEYGEEEEDPRNVRRRAEEGQPDQNAPRKIVRIQGVSHKPSNDVRIYLAKLIVELEKSGYFSDVKFEKDTYAPEENQYGFEFVGYLAGN